MALDDELGRWMAENDSLREQMRAAESKPQPVQTCHRAQKSRDELSGHGRRRCATRSATSA